MIEAEKMLHLRKYVTLFRAGAKLQVNRYSYLSDNAPKITREGYTFRYVFNRVSMHDLRAHAACIKNYSTATQSSIEDIDHKVTSLCDSVRYGQVSAKNLKEIIELCNENNHQLDQSTGILLLKCCGNLLHSLEANERLKLTNQMWDLVKKTGEKLTLDHYNTLLDVHAENFNMIDPKQFLADMGVEPDENTYRLLLNMVAKGGNINFLKEIMSAMKEKAISIDEDSYNVLVESCALNGNITEAEHIITLMKNANFSMKKAYSHLACGYAKIGDVPNLVKILNDELLYDMSLIRIVKFLSISGNGQHIPVVLNYLTETVHEIKSDISKTIIELIRANQIGDAYTIINYFALKNITTDVTQNFINDFLNELVMINASYKDITSYASEFVDSGLEPLAFTNVAELGLKLGRENLCDSVFCAMKTRNIEIRPHYYWPLLIMGFHKEGESKVFSLIRSMIDMNVQLDSDTLINYVLPYINNADPIVIWKRLVIEKIPAIIVYTAVIHFLLSQNRLQDAATLCKHVQQKLYYRDIMKFLIRSYFVTGDVKSCVTILTKHSFGHNFVSSFLIAVLNDTRFKNRPEDLKYFLEEFKAHSVKISPRDANIIKNKLINLNFRVWSNSSMIHLLESLIDRNCIYSAYSTIPRLVYMNTKELACYLVEVKNKGILHKNTLRKLLESYCNENNLKKAEEIKHEIDVQGMQWTNGMKMYLFELYLRHNKLNEAEALLTDLQHGAPDTFTIDSIKILMFATALVKENRIDTAFKAIKSYPNANITREVQRHSYTLLETLACSKHYSHTKNMLITLVNNNYCYLNVEVLRPLMTIPLEQNDVLSALNVFITCARKYQKLPLAQELMTALLQNSSTIPDANRYIEEVYNAVTNVKDADAATTLLLVALATLEKTEELRLLSEKQNISMKYLINHLNYAQRRNDVNYFLKILEVLPDSNDTDIIVLCNMLLATYSKTGDYNSALALWKIMQTKNFKHDEKFVQAFTKLLISNKVELPSELKSANKVMDNQ